MLARKNILRRALLWALACLIALAPAAAADSSLECGVADISKYGNLVLDISGNAFLAQGFEYGDIVSVDIAGTACDMPVCAEYSDVEQGEMVCRVIEAESADASYVILAINMGDLAGTLGIATKSEIDEEPGFRWDYASEYADGVRVTLSMKEKGGYASDAVTFALTRSNDRADYPDLTDEQFANFRAVATTGMGANALYRSSSPVNPAIGRSEQADAALNAAGIQTVMNLADSEQTMRGYEGYAYTYYSQRDVIALNLGMDVASDDFRRGLAEGFRFLAEHDGPCLIHCKEGKERTGFAVALLECLMGASWEEVVADYMETYRNFYGVEPGTETYDEIWRRNIASALAAAFGVEDVAAEGIDLAVCAEEYLAGIGMSAGEIEALKARLGADIL